MERFTIRHHSGGIGRSPIGCSPCADSNSKIRARRLFLFLFSPLYSSRHDLLWYSRTYFLRDDTLLCVEEHERVRRSWIYGGPLGTRRKMLLTDGRYNISLS